MLTIFALIPIIIMLLLFGFSFSVDPHVKKTRQTLVVETLKISTIILLLLALPCWLAWGFFYLITTY